MLLVDAMQLEKTFQPNSYFSFHKIRLANASGVERTSLLDPTYSLFCFCNPMKQKLTKNVKEIQSEYWLAPPEEYLKTRF
jgi:hypothetical protein